MCSRLSSCFPDSRQQCDAGISSDKLENGRFAATICCMLFFRGKKNVRGDPWKHMFEVNAALHDNSDHFNSRIGKKPEWLFGQIAGFRVLIDDSNRKLMESVFYFTTNEYGN